MCAEFNTRYWKLATYTRTKCIRAIKSHRGNFLWSHSGRQWPTNSMIADQFSQSHQKGKFTTCARSPVIFQTRLTRRQAGQRRAQSNHRRERSFPIYNCEKKKYSQIKKAQLIHTWFDSRRTWRYKVQGRPGRRAELPVMKLHNWLTGRGYCKHRRFIAAFRTR